VPSRDPGNVCKNTPPPALRLTEVQRGLTKPVFLTHAPGDAERLFVVEIAGRVRVLRSGTLEPTPFMDIVSIVKSDAFVGEQGLLGIAFHPRFAETGRLWVSYTAKSGNGDNVVAEYRVGPNGTVDNASARILVNEVHPSFLGNHNGGMLAFGPDGCLYTSLGDGGDGDDPGDRGQNPAEPLGSILRIDVDAFPAPAPGNMTGQGVDPRLWGYGLRNPWRFSFDRSTGDLYIGDVGQGAWEEIDVEPAGTGHRNYGWKVMEGKHCRVGATCDQTGMTLPAVEQPNGVNKAIIGGYVYRGAAIPGMVGRYVYGDHISRKLWTFTYAGESGGQPTVCDEAELPVTPAGDITSFGEDAAGELYLLTLNGIVYRLDPG
jgi:glucose/arabinose dehydrogenase